MVPRERLLTLWEQDPDARALAALFPFAFELEIAPRREGPPGSYWEGNQRLGEQGSHWYDRVTGLPLEVLRPRDRAPMVLVPAGAVPVGDQSHRRVVHLGGLWIDRFPVTRGRFRLFLEAHSEAPEVEEARRAYDRSSQGLPPQHPSFPMAPVPPPLAERYAAWVGARLPTAEEWEKAARGIDGAALPWGERPSHTLRANFDPYLGARRFPRGARDPARVGDYLEPVGSFPSGRSPFGMEEAAGGVFEICRDGHGFPVLKGSSWISRLDELHLGREIWYHRHALPEEEARGIPPEHWPVGFRLVLAVESPSQEPPGFPAPSA